MSYFGKTVAVEPALDDIRRAAKKSGFSIRILHETDGLPLLALSRFGSGAGKSVYLSAGIHGDEPAGPLAILELLEADLPQDITWHICPALNPSGLRAGTRANAAGADLNRDYLALSQPEVRAHVEWLSDQGIFDLALFLHEDWECNGFYLYELNPSPELFSAARPMLRAVESHCPIENGRRIDGHEAQNGVITPLSRDLRRKDWPEALYVFTHHTRLNYTLEAPSSFALHTRVEALQAAVLAGVGALRDGSF
jgi:murein peptide amidase A